MASRSVTASTMRADAPPRHPHIGEGADGGEVFDRPLTVAAAVDRLYEGWQKAIDEAGGTIWLAASMERSHPDVSKRVRHVRNDKGEVMKTTLDMVGHILVDDPDDKEKKNEKARAVFVAFVNDLCGYEMPKKKRRQKSPEEKAAESKQELLKFGEKGREAVERIFGDDA